MVFEELQVDSPVGRVALARAARRDPGRPARADLRSAGRGKTPLFRALSGLWPWGSGRIVRPRGESVMYVPRGTPYLPRGTLREALAYPSLTDRFADRAYAQALERMGLRRYVKSLDADKRWDRELSEDEQMALALARVVLHAPLWVVFDDTFSSMEDETLRRVDRSLFTKHAHADDHHSHRAQHAGAHAAVHARAAFDEAPRARDARRETRATERSLRSGHEAVRSRRISGRGVERSRAITSPSRSIRGPERSRSSAATARRFSLAASLARTPKSANSPPRRLGREHSVAIVYVQRPTWAPGSA